MGEVAKQHETPKVIERLTRKEMVQKYPNQYLGIANIQYKDNDGVTLESADIIYTDKTENELFKMQLESKGKIRCLFTNDDTYPLGFATL